MPLKKGPWLKRVAAWHCVALLPYVIHRLGPDMQMQGRSSIKGPVCVVGADHYMALRGLVSSCVSRTWVGHAGWCSHAP